MMTRRKRYLLWGATALSLAMAFVMLMPIVTQGASQFANPAFQQQWQSVERVIPNFYGPLTTANDATTEPYIEGQYNGQSGVRLVQYFDKARLEQITPSRRITSGLLTVELKTGNLQLGDSTFAQNSPANIGIAGDPGGGGPTYADLMQLPEKSAQGGGSVNLKWDPSTNTYANITALSDPQTTFVEYLSDPSGRFGQNVPRAFADFLKRIPGGYLLPMGYPIGPAFVANVRLKGVDNVPIVIQPFQRRVLTYTASNREATRVEFGNIGRHYYQWRISLGGNGSTSVPGNTLTPPVFITNTPGPTATETPVSSGTPTATATPNGNATNVAGTATQAAINATTAVFQGTATVTANLATGTSLTATAAVLQATADTFSQAATNTANTATAFATNGTASAVAAQTQAAANAQATATQDSQNATGAAIAFATQTAAARATSIAQGTPAAAAIRAQALLRKS